METRRFNEVAYFQVGIARKYMRRHGLTPMQFVERDKQYHILHLLEVGYEPYHLTGDEGVLDEIDEIVAEQQAAKPAEMYVIAPSIEGPLKKEL